MERSQSEEITVLYIFICRLILSQARKKNKKKNNHSTFIQGCGCGVLLWPAKSGRWRFLVFVFKFCTVLQHLGPLES